MIEFFHALGLPLAELWGMSETCGAGACNPPDRDEDRHGRARRRRASRSSSADDGEVLIRGPVVMKGYRNAPEQDAPRRSTRTAGCTPATSAEFDEDGYLKIVDRKKELIINAGGKNMSPANIEAKVKASSPLIGQAVAIGDGRPYNVALITLDPDVAPGVRAAARHRGRLVRGAGRRAGGDRRGAARGRGAPTSRSRAWSRSRSSRSCPTDWEPGGDELTPTMKLKRKPIHEKYA